MTEHVTLVEVGPRDGLQNQSRLIPTADKVTLVNILGQTGLTRIEVTSFVSPKWVPQMADAAEVLAAITRVPGLAYTALTPNLRGLVAAQASGVSGVAVFAAASESFSQHNINCSVAQSLSRFAPVLAAARQADLPVRGYVSCVTDCPYEGPVAAHAVADVAQALYRMGCHEISLGETLGSGEPEAVDAMLAEVGKHVPVGQLAGHFHDTKGRACDNIAVALDHGLRVFDTAIGGLGGCPYAPGAAGNVATETIVNFLADQGFATGIHTGRLAEAAAFAQNLKAQTQ